MGFCRHDREQLFSELTTIREQLTQVLAQGDTMTVEMDGLTASVGKLVTDIDTTIAEAQAAATKQRTALDAATAQVTALVAGDVISAAEIADLKAQLAALGVAASTMTASINAVDVAVTTAGANLGVTLPPAVPAVVPASGPVGAVVNITGTGFGAAMGSSTLVFGGVSIDALHASWSDTSIQVTVPVSAVSGDVVVTVNGVVMTGTFTVTP